MVTGEMVTVTVHLPLVDGAQPDKTIPLDVFAQV